MDFKIGDRITGYLEEDGLSFTGYIISFVQSEKDNPKAYVKTLSGSQEICLLNTCHHTPKDEATHNKETFLAAVSRCSPVLYFKDSKARRDFTETLWNELVRFSQNKD